MHLLWVCPQLAATASMRSLTTIQDQITLTAGPEFRLQLFPLFVRFSFVFYNFCVRRGEGQRHGGAARPARPLGPGRALAATNTKIEKGGQKMDLGENLGTRQKSRGVTKISGRGENRGTRRKSRDAAKISGRGENLGTCQKFCVEGPKI